MERSAVLKQVNNIFAEILDDTDLILTDSSSAEEIEDWDSLTNIQLIVTVEKYFKIKFISIEIQMWKNIGEMVDCIVSKIN